MDTPNEKSRSTAGEILQELYRAREKHPTPMHSSHEGFAVLKEEVDELWDEVKHQTEDRSYARMRKEAVQIGAMALRFIEDVCDSRIKNKKGTV